ncbi:glycosyltransferase [Pelagibacteraceae bacterium]|nr:glycosyltransferase [Candidatus Pelagibacter bacterium]MDC1254268.1 glycosyltransferase [Pelagibacteraceae bacterium]
MSIKFSIIVPNYNGKIFLKRCLDSILSQSYTNYELIVIDGHSNDGSVELLKTYGNKIQWVSEKDNGQADAINKGIKRCSGDWLTWQNSDDFYSNNNSLLTFEKAINKNQQKKLIVANINLVNLEEKTLRDVKYLKPYYFSLLYEGMTLTNQACFWKKELNNELGYLRDIRLNFDYEWFMRILKTYPGTGHHVNKTLACFRLHKSQKTQNPTYLDQKQLNLIKTEYGYNKKFSIIIRPLLLIRKFFYHLLQGNFYYLLRGFLKFFFGKKNKEYKEN